LTNDDDNSGVCSAAGCVLGSAFGRRGPEKKGRVPLAHVVEVGSVIPALCSRLNAAAVD
jgi:hypothetical protein